MTVQEYIDSQLECDVIGFEIIDGFGNIVKDTNFDSMEIDNIKYIKVAIFKLK